MPILIYFVPLYTYKNNILNQGNRVAGFPIRDTVGLLHILDTLHYKKKAKGQKNSCRLAQKKALRLWQGFGCHFLSCLTALPHTSP
jgi:hypothetical protein